MVRTYHATLDLVSDAALDAFPELVSQAQAYGDAIRAYAPAGAILDLGSGVGLPGVVIGSMFPDRRVWLVERRRRRATFLKMVVGRLALRRTVVIEADVTRVQRETLTAFGSDGAPGDDLNDTSRLDEGRRTDDGAAAGVRVVTAQAVASFADVYGLTRHLHAASVTLISRKGPAWREEVDALADAIGTSPAVLGEGVAVGGGTLISIEVRGGLPCPRSA